MNLFNIILSLLFWIWIFLWWESKFLFFILNYIFGKAFLGGVKDILLSKSQKLQWSKFWFRDIIEFIIAIKSLLRGFLKHYKSQFSSKFISRQIIKLIQVFNSSNLIYTTGPIKLVTILNLSLNLEMTFLLISSLPILFFFQTN